MKPKDYISKKAQEEALKAFGATQLNNNQESSAYFVGKISADRKKITDPNGKEYDLIFTGSPKEYELAQRLSDNKAVVNAQNNKTINVDGTNPRYYLIYTLPSEILNFPDSLKYSFDAYGYNPFDGGYYLDGKNIYRPGSVRLVDTKTGRYAIILKDIADLFDIEHCQFGTSMAIQFRIDPKSKHLMLFFLGKRSSPLPWRINYTYINQYLATTSSAVDCFGTLIDVMTSCTAENESLHDYTKFDEPVINYKIFKNFSLTPSTDNDFELIFKYEDLIEVNNKIIEYPNVPNIGYTQSITYEKIGGGVFADRYSAETYSIPSTAVDFPYLIFTDEEILFFFDVFAGSNSGFIEYYTTPASPGGATCSGTIDIPGCQAYKKVEWIMTPFTGDLTPDGVYKIIEVTRPTNPAKGFAVSRYSYTGIKKNEAYVSRTDPYNISLFGFQSAFNPKYEIKDNILYFPQIISSDTLTTWTSLLHSLSLDTLSFSTIYEHTGEPRDNFLFSIFSWEVKKDSNPLVLSIQDFENSELLHPENMVFAQVINNQPFNATSIFAITRTTTSVPNTKAAVIFTFDGISEEFFSTFYTLSFGVDKIYTIKERTKIKLPYLNSELINPQDDGPYNLKTINEGLILPFIR